MEAYADYVQVIYRLKKGFIQTDVRRNDSLRWWPKAGGGRLLTPTTTVSLYDQYGTKLPRLSCDIYDNRKMKFFLMVTVPAVEISKWSSLSRGGVGDMDQLVYWPGVASGPDLSITTLLMLHDILYIFLYFVYFFHA